jgi:hypothetical protein
MKLPDVNCFDFVAMKCETYKMENSVAGVISKCLGTTAANLGHIQEEVKNTLNSVFPLRM